MSTFQENLKKYRERLGINAKDFAAQVDIKYTTYLAYENEGREPKYDTLCNIAAALHVSIDELLGYESSPRRLAEWQNYLADTSIRIVCDGNKVIMFLGGDNGMEAYKRDQKTGADSVTKAVFPSMPAFLQFMSDVEKTAKAKALETEKIYIETQLTAHIKAVSVNCFMESLKDFESYKPHDGK